ncbi:MAG: DUF2846 domain-containing protein [Terriglobales bacterium]
MIKMNFLLATFLLASLAFAQDQSSGSGKVPACGAPDSRFDVKTDTRRHTAQPEPGKALVYFIQDDSDYASRPRPTARVGIDGQWVGATHADSYFYFSVDPGVHHICASWQDTEETRHNTAAAHFTAETNRVYYYLARDSSPYGGSAFITLNVLDSDEGQFLSNELEFSASQLKK